MASLSPSSWASLVVFIASLWFYLIAVCVVCSVVDGSVGVGVLVVVGRTNYERLVFTKSHSMESKIRLAFAAVSQVMSFGR